jgi:hypothetical protein
MRNVGTVVATMVVAVAAWIVYGQLSTPVGEPLDPYRREAARLVSVIVAQTISIDNQLDGPVAFLPLVGDSRGEVSQLLRRALDDSGKYRLLDPAVVDAALSKLGLSADQARSDAKGRNELLAALSAQGVMSGTIDSFPDPRGQRRTELRLTLRAVDTRGQQVLEQRFAGAIEPSLFSLPWLRAELAATSPMTRFLLGLLAVLLAPVLLLKVIAQVLAKDSNLPNLVLLLSLTAWGALTAWVALGLRVDGFWSGMAWLVAIAASALYNYVAVAAVEYYQR